MGRLWAHGERIGLVPKLVWRVKLAAELRPNEVLETEVARIERDEQAGMAELGHVALTQAVLPSRLIQGPDSARRISMTSWPSSCPTPACCQPSRR